MLASSGIFARVSDPAKEKKMIKRRVGIAVSTAALLPLTVAFASGGWWVHTVEELPEYFVAGEPVEMTISLRQHGIALVPNGSMVTEVHLTGPDSAAQVIQATPSARPGYHTANILVSEPGEWSIAVQSGYMRLELLPLRAVAPGSALPAPLTAVERGRQLYVSKGCVTCHNTPAATAARTVAMGAGITRLTVAPELIGRPFPSREYVEEVMANPGRRAMPNLNLSRDEISAIATYLNPET
jgi:mono/diheme cytochrome c family protein